MMEIAASKLCDTQSPKDVSLVISKKDLLHLASISCIQSALGRVCDVKGIFPPFKRGSSLTIRQKYHPRLLSIAFPL